MSAGNGKAFEPEFIQIPYAVFRDPGLSHAAKLTYGRLKLYAGEDGRAFPKHETLAEEVCLGPRQLKNVLVELRAAGWIGWTRARASCLYTVFSDRQKIAHQIGKKLPIRQAENCLSREARNCLQKRSIEDHHQEKSEKKKPESAVEGSTGGATSKEKPKAKTFKSEKSDDEKPKTAREGEIYAHPEDELKAIYRAKTGDEISPDTERRIWDLIEIRGVSRKQFMDELRKHVPNVWKNPAGFLTNFGRKIGSVTAPEPPAPKPIEPPKNDNGRCSGCNGNGYVHWDADPAARVYCDCRMGRELKRVDVRLPAPAPMAIEATA